MIEAIKVQNITNNEETDADNELNNQKNLHIIKCEEKKTELIILNPRINQLQILTISKYNPISAVTLSAIAIVFTIISLATLIKNNKTYKQIKDNLNIDTDKTYTKIWKNIGKYELGILIPCLIFLFILLLYNLFFLLKERKVIHLEINQGSFYYFLLILNFVLYVILYIFCFFVCYLNVYSIFVVAKIPNDFKTIDLFEYYKKRMKENIALLIVHIVSNFLIVFLSSFIIMPIINNLKAYIDMNFEENEKIKTGILSINNLNFSIKLKSDYLYLLQSEENKENFYQIADLENPNSIKRNESRFQLKIKCLAFKKIYINDYTNQYMYMILEYKSIADQLPLANEGFNNLFFLFLFSLCNLLFISIPSSKIHIKNEKDYVDSIKENIDKENKKFFGIYENYGNFEEIVTTIRIIYMTLEVFCLFILIIRRLIYGGFKNIIRIKSSIIFYILLVIIFFIDIIISILIIIYSILSTFNSPSEKTIETSEENYSEGNEFNYNYEKKELVETSIITIKLVFQIVVNCLALLFADIALGIFKFKTLLYHFDILKSWNKINENIICRNLNREIVFDDRNLNKEIVFEYRNLNNNRKRLAEFRIEGFPKFLFFKDENNSKRNNREGSGKDIQGIIRTNNGNKSESKKIKGDISNKIKY